MNHICGGTITRHASPDVAAEPRDYLLCDRCGAFRYIDEKSQGLPSGVDPDDNQEAWDDGEDESPDADPAEAVRA